MVGASITSLFSRSKDGFIVRNKYYLNQDYQDMHFNWKVQVWEGKGEIPLVRLD
jgi:hypothetical protein